MVSEPIRLIGLSAIFILFEVVSNGCFPSPGAPSCDRKFCLISRNCLPVKGDDLFLTLLVTAISSFGDRKYHITVRKFILAYHSETVRLF